MMGLSRLLKIFALSLIASTVWAEDAELGFIFEICVAADRAHGVLPEKEIHASCSCLVDNVRQRIDGKQRQSIRRAKSLLAQGKEVPTDIFERSGLKSIMEEEQDNCMKSLWGPPNISNTDHQRFAQKANTSVENYEQFVEDRCGLYPPSSTRSGCLVKASYDWLMENGSRYSDVPDSYITGNDLAKSIIEAAR